MQFTKLRLSGFKSFVDATELHILPGLTGVVGPNGCGKSNLLEALRWVMGETSAKSMRGSGMEDVIFAGADTRPPRNFAEVALSIDNKERRAPEGFNDADEMEITRRIAKDAGSSYRYNGKDIRARDAQTLFADMATGASSPALVRQGQISELINAKPKARRRILEDAAGVAGLHSRRHEATLRLNATESNLQRILEVLSELEAREAALTREAARAATYRETSKKLRVAEAILLFRRWREADRERASAVDAMQRIASDAGEAAQAAAEAQRRRIELEDGAPRLRETEAIARALHQKLLLERQALEQQERDARSTAERLSRQRREIGRDIEREGAIAADAGQMLEKLSSEAETLAADDGAAAEDVGPARLAEDAAAARVRVADAALDQMNADTAQAEANRAAAERRRDESASAADRLERERADAEGARAALDDDRAEAEATLEEAAFAREEAVAATEDADAAAEIAETERRGAEAAAAEARSRRSEAAAAAGALRAEAAELERLASDPDDSAQPLLAAVRAEPGFEAALGAAVGDDLESGEIDPADPLGWIALPPISGSTPLPAGAEPLAARVDAPNALARRLSQVGVVSPEDARRLQASLAPGQRLVTQDGDLWRWDGFKAAADARPSAAAARLARRNRLDAVVERLAMAEATEAEIAAAAEEADDASRAAAERDAAARDARRSAERRAAEATQAAGAAEAALGALSGRTASLDELIAARRRDADAARAAADAAAEEASALALLDAGDVDAARAATQAEAEAARAALIDARAEREALERRAEMRRQRRETVERDLADWRRRLEAATEQRETLSTRLEELIEELEIAEAAPLEIEERRAGYAADIAAAEAKLTDAVDALAAAEAGLKEAVAAEKAAEARLSEAREGRARLEAKAEAAGTRAEDLGLQLAEAAGVEPAAFLERFELDPDELPTVKELERQITALRQKRHDLGSVNLRADEDLKELTKQREDLAREREDLQLAVNKLRQGVAALNREGRERLRAAFEEVNRNFTVLFTHLFNGGDARLLMVESDDPLEAGLEVACQPPGKRLDSLSLLSGGEQTLTAVALIFAVFMVNPAPICVLDEVDAPLDDANVARFCDLLEEMTRRTNTRFLIITHHAVSMSRMDRLFGVTMVERGVSQLVSVDLKQAVALAEAS